MNNNGYASNIVNSSGAPVTSVATPAGHRKRQQELQVCVFTCEEGRVCEYERRGVCV